MQRHCSPPEQLHTHSASQILLNSSSSPITLQSLSISTEPTSPPPPPLPSQPIGINIKGWSITTNQSTIMPESQVDELTTKLRTSSGGKKLNPPECVFGDSYLTIQNVASTGEVMFEVSFNPIDALTEWADCHVKGAGEDGVKILKSIDAKTWDVKRGRGVASSSSSSTSSSSSSSSSESSSFSSSAISNIKTTSEMLYDWTYSTPYTCTTTTTPTKKWSKWSKSPSTQIPLALLTDKTQPILYFHNVNLYSDDMHDNGDVTLTVKIRVMPKCWYVLMRFYLRVDLVVIRVRDVRMFHEFGTDSVHRDVTWRESSWEELREGKLTTDVKMWREEVITQDMVGRVKIVKGPEGVDDSSVCRLAEVGT